MERKLVICWLLAWMLPALALVFALSAPGLWAKSGKWIIPGLFGLNFVLILASVAFATAIAVRMAARLLQRKRA